MAFLMWCFNQNPTEPPKPQPEPPDKQRNEQRDRIRNSRPTMPGPRNGGCFIGTTIVQAEEGPMPISEIRIGDKVWSYNFAEAKLELRTVTDLKQARNSTLIHIDVNNIRVICTTDHKFYNSKGGKYPAGDIPQINLVSIICNKSMAPKDVYADGRVSSSPHSETVYNLIVEDNHNFIVSEMWILVANGFDKNPQPGNPYKRR